MTRHPSGRPIAKREIKGRPMWRVPDRGPVIPRLQDPPRVNAIGFRVAALPGHQDDRDED